MHSVRFINGITCISHVDEAGVVALAQIPEHGRLAQVRQLGHVGHLVKLLGVDLERGRLGNGELLEGSM